VSIAIVYSTDGKDLWRVRKSIASIRRLGIGCDIFLLTLAAGAGVADDPYIAAECKGVVPVDGTLGAFGFKPDGWNRRRPYSTLACLAVPLLDALSGYDRALSVGSDVLAFNLRFSEWLTAQTRGFEVVGAASPSRTAMLCGGRMVESDACLSESAAAAMRDRVWRLNPPHGRMHAGGGIYLWDIGRIRKDIGWYGDRLKWFWHAETQGRVVGLVDTFVSAFADSAALMDPGMCATRADVQWTQSVAAFYYDGQAGADKPDCEFNKAAAAIGLDAVVSGDAAAAAAVRPADKPASMLPCSAGKLAVVHITDGNPDDCQRMVWSLRSISRYSKLAFDSFVLTPPGVKIPDIASAVPQAAAHGTFRQIDDIDKTLGELSITPAGWNRSWPFVVLYRLGIPLHPAFRDYDRVLYLDTDVLVLSERVDAFLSADLRGHEVGGVVDTVQEEHGRIRRSVDEDLRPDFSVKVSDRYGAVLRLKPYVNAGVLLWNLPEIRRDIPWYRERLRMFWEAECRGKFGFLDQDFINAMMTVNTNFSMVYNWFAKSGVEPDDGVCVIRHYCAHNYEKMAKRAEEIGLLTKEEVAKRHGKL